MPREQTSVDTFVIKTLSEESYKLFELSHVPYYLPDVKLPNLKVFFLFLCNSGRT